MPQPRSRVLGGAEKRRVELFAPWCRTMGESPGSVRLLGDTRHRGQMEFG
jgi:hypothetical protein